MESGNIYSENRIKNQEGEIAMVLLQRLTVVCIIVLSLCSAANAEEESESGWKWRVAPLYLWVINIEGDTSIGPITAPVEINLSDVFSDIEGVFTVNFEGVHNNRWGFIVDFTWIDISGSLGPATLDFEYIQGEVDGFYRFPMGDQSIDFLVGARYYSQDIKLAPLPVPIVSVAVSEDWVDPIVGGRWTVPLSEKVTLITRGDIGGFGAGSDLTWQALALVDWQPWKHASIVAGFRALYVDYETGSGLNRFAYDATTWGPLFGFNLKW